MSYVKLRTEKKCIEKKQKLEIYLEPNEILFGSLESIQEQIDFEDDFQKDLRL